MKINSYGVIIEVHYANIIYTVCLFTELEDKLSESQKVNAVLEEKVSSLSVKVLQATEKPISKFIHYLGSIIMKY